LFNIIHVTFDFIQTLLSQPTYDGPTEAQPAGAVLPPPNREAMALDEIHGRSLQGKYQEDSEPDIDQDDFFGDDI
jgi:hypothetical protein